MNDVGGCWAQGESTTPGAVFRERCGGGEAEGEEDGEESVGVHFEVYDRRGRVRLWMSEGRR